MQFLYLPQIYILLLLMGCKNRVLPRFSAPHSTAVRGCLLRRLSAAALAAAVRRCLRNRRVGYWQSTVGCLETSRVQKSPIIPYLSPGRKCISIRLVATSFRSIQGGGNFGNIAAYGNHRKPLKTSRLEILG